MDVSFREAMLSSDAFEIIQNAFIRSPTKMEKSAYEQMERLKVNYFCWSISFPHLFSFWFTKSELNDA